MITINWWIMVPMSIRLESLQATLHMRSTVKAEEQLEKMLPSGTSASVIPNFSGTMDSDLKADGGAGMHGNFEPKSELVARADMRARAGMNADMKTNMGSRLGDLGAKLSAGMTTGMKAKAGMRNGMKADMRAGVDLTGGFGAGF
ncbi:hypothetical protein DSO57_1008610 [Entomophthora muscae]|uniref:Uncharacterized protein n=1 Tax=Entomophthora muscae TaxID=34485 RepID=A0ACC2S913_9FUNG|nr:hypothetical protein DSO57_1008610 [Entomophthora muscae]